MSFFLIPASHASFHCLPSITILRCFFSLRFLFLPFALCATLYHMYYSILPVFLTSSHSFFYTFCDVYVCAVFIIARTWNMLDSFISCEIFFFSLGRRVGVLFILQQCARAEKMFIYIYGMNIRLGNIQKHIRRAPVASGHGRKKRKKARRDKTVFYSGATTTTTFDAMQMFRTSIGAITGCLILISSTKVEQITSRSAPPEH